MSSDSKTILFSDMNTSHLEELINAEGEGREPGRLAVLAHRLAGSVRDGSQRMGERDLDCRVGEAGEFAGDLFERPIADDVVDADAQELLIAEPPQYIERLFQTAGGSERRLQLRQQLCGGAVHAHQVGTHTVASEVQKGKRPHAPAFSLPTLDGGSLASSSLVGKPQVLNFWASWCIPCRNELPHLRSLYEKHRGEGLEIVGVSLDEKDDAARKFLSEQKLPWQQIVGDAARHLGEEWGIDHLPTVFVIDRSGRLLTTQGYGKLDELLPKLLAK